MDCICRAIEGGSDFLSDCNDGLSDPHIIRLAVASSPGVEVHKVNFPLIQEVANVKIQERLRLIVDSGAQSCCISSDKIGLVKVTDRGPNWRVKVANGTLLKVVAIGDLTLIDLDGFKLETYGSRVLRKTSGT